MSKNVGDAFGEKRYLRLECYLDLRPDQSWCQKNQNCPSRL